MRRSRPLRCNSRSGNSCVVFPADETIEDSVEVIALIADPLHCKAQKCTKRTHQLDVEPCRLLIDPNVE